MGDDAETLKRAIEARIDAYVACARKHIVLTPKDSRMGADAYVPEEMCGENFSSYAAERAEDTIAVQLQAIRKLRTHFPGFRVHVATYGGAHVYREPGFFERMFER